MSRPLEAASLNKARLVVAARRCRGRTRSRDARPEDLQRAVHRVAAEHGVSIGAVDAQPHLALVCSGRISVAPGYD